MVKPFANPRGKKSKVEVLPNRFARETITGDSQASRAHGYYGKKGSPHQAMDDFITASRVPKDDESHGIDSVSVPDPI